VFDFLLERFKAWYQSEGISVEVFQSVLALKPAKPLEFHRRVHAVHEFSRLPEAQALAAANKRVSNILQKQGTEFSKAAIDPALLRHDSERRLVAVLEQMPQGCRAAVRGQPFCRGAGSACGFP